MPNQLEIGIVQLLKLNGVTSLKSKLRSCISNKGVQTNLPRNFHKINEEYTEYKNLVWMALEGFFPEGLLQDFLLWLQAAHLLHPQNQAKLVELRRQEHLI